MEKSVTSSELTWISTKVEVIIAESMIVFLYMLLLTKNWSRISPLKNESELWDADNNQPPEPSCIIDAGNQSALFFFLNKMQPKENTPPSRQPRRRSLVVRIKNWLTTSTTRVTYKVLAIKLPVTLLLKSSFKETLGSYIRGSIKTLGHSIKKQWSN